MLPSDTNDSKWLKSDIEQMKDELAHSRNDTSDRLFSMEVNVYSVQNQLEPIDTRINTMMTQMASVSVKIFSSHSNTFCLVSRVTQLDDDGYGTRQNG